MFIAGFGRCGSTLLDRILGQLPGLTSLGELRDLFDGKGFDSHWCACERRVPECPFWSEVLGATMRDLDLDEPSMHRLRETEDRQRFLVGQYRHARHKLRRSDSTQTPYGELLYTVYRHAIRVAGTEGVVDSSKMFSPALILATDRLVDLRVVNLVRDPRGAAYSWSRQKLDPGKSGASIPVYTPLSSSMWWSISSLECELLLRPLLGSRYQQLRYEDVVSDPAGVLGKLADSLGYRAGDLPLVQGDSGAVFADIGDTHLVGGNPNRFDTGRVPIRLDERWMTSMSGQDRLRATVPAAPLLWRYDYALWPSGSALASRNTSSTPSDRAHRT